MKKFLAAAGIAAMTALLALLLCQDAFLKFAFEKALSRTTGFPTKIGNFHYRYPGEFQIQGMTLYNPRGFEGLVFAECPRLVLILNMPEFVRRERLHIYLMELSVQKVSVEKNPEGISNLSLLAPYSTTLPFSLGKLRLSLKYASSLDRSVQPAVKSSAALNVEREESDNLESSGALFALLAGKVSAALAPPPEVPEQPAV